MQGDLILSIFQNRDLLKVNTQEGRRGMPKGIPRLPSWDI